MSYNDPNAIVNVINAGASYAAQHLIVSGVDRWIALSGGVFSLTTDEPPTGLKISESIFNKLANATVDPDGVIITEDESYYQAISQAGFFKLADP